MRKILVVEDNPIFNKTVCSFLEKEGYKTIPAYDGFEALDFAKINEPDLILLDIIMPGKEGVSVYVELKTMAATCDVPVLLISGAPPGNILSLTETKKINREDIFIKPFDFPRLLSRIRFYLE